jgi:hypothetical protein
MFIPRESVPFCNVPRAHVHAARLRLSHATASEDLCLIIMSRYNNSGAST